MLKFITSSIEVIIFALPLVRWSKVSEPLISANSTSNSKPLSLNSISEALIPKLKFLSFMLDRWFGISISIPSNLILLESILVLKYSLEDH